MLLGGSRGGNISTFSYLLSSLVHTIRKGVLVRWFHGACKDVVEGVVDVWWNHAELFACKT